MLNVRAHGGFSMIESLLTVVVLSILVATALPSLGEWMANARIRTVADAVNAGLQYARVEAVRRNVQIEFRLAETSGVTFDVVDPSSGAVLQQRRTGESLDGPTIVGKDAGGTAATRVTFNGLGQVVANASGGASLARVDFDLPTDVLPAAKTRDLRIMVGGGGRIRMCDPNVATTGDPRKC